ncbi:MAG: MATE family efflux transporter [bacterium]
MGSRCKFWGRDPAEGNLIWNVWYLGLPMALSSFLFGLPGLSDAFWVGKLGPSALAGLGITVALRMLMISPIMGLATGGGAVIARYVGAGEGSRANLAAFQAVFLVVLFAGAIGATGFLFVGGLVRLMGGREDVVPLAIIYGRVIFAGLIAMEFLPSIGFLLNAAGSPNFTLWANIICTVVTLASEPLLIFGLGPLPGLGIGGAGLSIVFGSAVGSAYLLSVLLTGRARVRIDIRNLRLDWPIMRRIIAISLPSTAQRGMPNLSNTILMRIVSIYGTSALATYSVVMRAVGFLQSLCFGFSRASTTLVGQNLGAGKPLLAERSGWIVALITTGVMALGMGSMAIFARGAMGAFNADPEVVSMGVTMIRITAFGQVVLIFATSLDSALSGAGDTISPMVISTLSLWLVQLPLAYMFSRLTAWGPNGVWTALVFTNIFNGALMALRFWQGRWKHKEI